MEFSLVNIGSILKIFHLVGEAFLINKLKSSNLFNSLITVFILISIFGFITLISWMFFRSSLIFIGVFFTTLPISLLVFELSESMLNPIDENSFPIISINSLSNKLPLVIADNSK